MKAHLVRASQQVSLTPDSAEVEYAALKQWAEEEKDTVGRAVLHSIVGSWMMANEPDSIEAAIAYFRASVAPKEVLGRTSAKEFRPMTESGKNGISMTICWTCSPVRLSSRCPPCIVRRTCPRRKRAWNCMTG